MGTGLVFNIVTKDSMGNVLTNGQINVLGSPVMQNKLVAEALKKAAQHVAEKELKLVSSVTISIATL